MKYYAKIDSKLLFYALFIFPYVTFGLVASDNSPFYLLGFMLLGGIFFLYNPDLSIKKPLFYVICISVLLLLLEIISMKPFIELIKFIAAFYFILVLWYSPKMLQIQSIEKIIFWLSIIWVIATIASFLFPGIFSFLFFRTSTDLERGATGLSTEPANWGQASAFMIILCHRVFTEGRKKYLAISAFTISCLLSLSAFGLIYLIFSFWFILGFKRTFFLGLFGLVCLVLFLPETSRLYFLLNLLFSSDGIQYLLLKDSSITTRLNAFFTIPKIFASGLFFGQYFSGLNLTEARFGGGNFTMSGINILVFRYGIFGLAASAAFIGVILRFINHSLKGTKTLDRLPIYLDLFIMTFVGPLAFPYFYLALMDSDIEKN